MSPLMIQILFHYYSRGDDFRGGDFSAPAVRYALDRFVKVELLQPRTSCYDIDVDARSYTVTERGLVYLKALMAVPLPEQQFVMPKPYPTPEGE